MKITKKLRNHILHILDQIVMEKIEEHCPNASGNLRAQLWDEMEKNKHHLITDVTKAIQCRVQANLNTLVR